MASSLKPDILVNPSDLFVQISNTSGTVPYNTGNPEVGVRAVTGDGREFRYVQNGAAAQIIGQVQQGYAQQSNLQGVTAVAIAASTSSTNPSVSTTLTISTGTAIASNALVGGLYETYGTVANGGGQSLRISANNAVSSSGTSLVLTLEDPVSTTITTSATVNIVPPVYQGTVQLPTTQTNAVAGVAMSALPASYFGWVQVKGLSNVLIQGTPAAYTGLAASTSTAGALAVVAATTGQLAINLATGTDGRYGPVNLLIS